MCGSRVARSRRAVDALRFVHERELLLGPVEQLVRGHAARRTQLGREVDQEQPWVDPRVVEVQIVEVHARDRRLPAEWGGSSEHGDPGAWVMRQVAYRTTMVLPTPPGPMKCSAHRSSGPSTSVRIASICSSRRWNAMRWRKSSSRRFVSTIVRPAPAIARLRSPEPAYSNSAASGRATSIQSRFVATSRTSKLPASPRTPWLPPWRPRRGSPARSSRASVRGRRRPGGRRGPANRSAPSWRGGSRHHG